MFIRPRQYPKPYRTFYKPTQTLKKQVTAHAFFQDVQDHAKRQHSNREMKNTSSNTTHYISLVIIAIPMNITEHLRNNRRLFLEHHQSGKNDA